jgi:hypothetical protein
MHRGWLLFALSAVLAAAAVVVGVAGLSVPPLLLVALVLAGGSYACWSRARDHIVDTVYSRVGVEPNPDGTVGDEGARAERSRSGRVNYEPRDDWDDPDDWPFNDPFWTDDGTETDGGTAADRRGHGGATHPGAGSSGEADDETTDRADDGTRFVAPREREAREVLGVALDATPEDVRAAYRERVKETHPDRGGSEAAFKRVRWAYEYLRSRWE